MLFAHAEYPLQQLSPTIAFSPFTSADPAIKETSPLRLARRAPSNRSIPLERDLPPPLGESSGKAVNIVSHGPMKPVKSAVASASKTTLAKGTPNAGKLLKKATVSAAKEKLPPVPKVPSNAVTAKGVETRGKGKARK